MEITKQMLLQAKDNIQGIANRTPLIHSKKLDAMLGATVWLKCENLQITGAFKLRGALNKMLSLTPEQREKGVVAASSGNHAQAVAFVAQKLGIKATIVMPINAPTVKVEGAKSYGAQVVLHGYTGEDRTEKAMEIVSENGSVFIHSHDDVLIVSGHSTIAQEIFEDLGETVDMIICPCGGGGCLSGVSAGTKILGHQAKVIGVEPKAMPRYAESIKEHKAVCVPFGDTAADGLRITQAEQLNYEVISSYADEMVTVSNEYIYEAIKALLLQEKLLVEPSGSVGLAAILEGNIDVKGKTICLVLTGGNMDAALLKEIL